MSLPITNTARQNLQKIEKRPAIVLVFDGITEVFGSASILTPVRIGDVGLEIGDFIIGETTEVADQVDSISFDGSAGGATSTRINYKLSPDLGVAEAITAMRVALVDTQANQILALLASSEFLGRKVRVLLTPDVEQTSYPEDYITIFRGIVDDITLPPGMVIFSISHPDQKKRQAIFNTAETTIIGGSINNSVTSISLTDVSNMLLQGTCPDGTTEDDFLTYVRIDNEIIRYTGITAGASPAGTITGCTRGALGTTAATHDDEANVKTFYRLNGNCVDLALKTMLSGWESAFATGVAINNFNFINSSQTISNILYFTGVDVTETYGLTVGDYVTTFGASNGANNVTDKTISAITVTGINSYITISGVTFVDEFDTSGTVSFRSQYDCFPDGAGLKMSPDEVDVAEHVRLKDLFLSGFDHDIYIKNTVESGKDFLSKEIYKPIACYSVPRKARSSMAYTIGPLPTDQIATLTVDNVINAEKVYKKRSIGRNFYNTIIYKYEESAISEEFLRGYVTTDPDSRTQIPVGTRAYVIETKGLRSEATILSSANRLLNRYAFGADYIENIKVTMEVGYSIEVADLVIVDGVSLKINDATTGSDTSDARFYEVVSKDFNIKTGEVTLGVVDTNFNDAGRYALIAPASDIKTGLSASSFIIQESYASEFGAEEFKKWDDFGQFYVKVRNNSYDTAATAQINNFSGNTVFLQDSLGFTPSAGMIMEFSDYGQATQEIKLLYGHIIESATATFADSASAYIMI